MIINTIMLVFAAAISLLNILDTEQNFQLKTRADKLEDTVARLRDEVSMMMKSNSRESSTTSNGAESDMEMEMPIEGLSSMSPNAYCGCNTFANATVSIVSPGQNVHLVVGTPETGFINGVNINSLSNIVSNQAILNAGSQNIEGSLQVQSLKIGLWTLGMDGDGNLNIDSTAGSGQVMLNAAASVESLTVEGHTALSSTVSVSGTLTGATITASQVNADEVTASEQYKLCNSNNNACITQYPRFESLYMTGTYVNETGLCFVTLSFSCPANWIPVSACALIVQSDLVDTCSNLYFIPPSTPLALTYGTFQMFSGQFCEVPMDYPLIVTCMIT
jgi:hypothetical protein